MNGDGLGQPSAQSVGRRPADVIKISISALAEGGFNRTFFITMRDDFITVAHIPYPVHRPQVPSELATCTMASLRPSMIPIPEVYEYSWASDNAAKTEYIFMESVRDPRLRLRPREGG